MASAGFIYLDIDDEITSAAARIRSADEVRLALVLPAGSRLATSRINFRLLAREAQSRSRELLIVAPEAATRALAGSAGLRVYASVRDLEADLDPEAAAHAGVTGEAPDLGPAERGAGARAASTRGAAGAGPAGAGAAGPGGPAGDAAAVAGIAASGATGAAGASSTRASGRTPAGSADEADAADRGPAGRGSARSGARPRSERRQAVDEDTQVHESVAEAGARGSGRLAGRPAEGRTRPAREARDIPVAAGEGRGRRRVGFAVVLGILALLVVVGSVLGYVFLPSATVVVTPRVEPLGPLSLSVRADPAVTAPDAATSVVPATITTFPLEVTQDFDATGSKITETFARGTVTFTSRNTADTVTIPAGTQVSTRAGVVFTTTANVTVPKAVFIPPTPGTADAPVRAVEAGTGGNVSAGAITKVSTGVQARLVNTEDPVSNADPTSGGTHKETTVVAAKDVDQATSALTKELQADLRRFVANPGAILPDMTVFPDTGTLSKPTPTVDRATLIGKPMERFTYGLSAMGAVTAVDVTVINALAEDRLRATAAPDHDVIAGSLAVTVGAGTIQGKLITFPVRATGSQVRRVDAQQLRSLIRGKPVQDAKTLLADYGEVMIDTWPDFVKTIPTYDFRLTVRIGTTAGVEGASPSPSDELPGQATPSTSDVEPTDGSVGSEAPSGQSPGESPSDSTAP